MAYTDHHNIAQDPVFIGRVQVPVVKAAVAVMAEDPGTAKHVQRVNLSVKILIDSANWAYRFAQALVTNSTIAGAIDLAPTDPLAAGTDSDLEFVVNSVFNAFAQEQL